MNEAFCKGCGLAIIPGQMRRGENWHADCFSDLERRVLGVRIPALPRRRIKGLTRTQTFIMEAAAKSPTGSVGFYRGDRLGTRVGSTDDMGRPWIVAYSNPAFFLEGRGLLEKANEPHVYRITDLGRSRVARRQPG